VKGIKFKDNSFGSFSLHDLDRLKNDDRWLSDSHVTLTLLWVVSHLWVLCHLKEAVIVSKIVSTAMFGGP
jgi:hypothetical protein